MVPTGRLPSPGEPGHPGGPGKQGEETGRGGEGGAGGAGGRGGGDSGEPGGRGGEGGPGGAGRSFGIDDDRANRWLDWTVRIVAVISLLLTGAVAGKVFKGSQCQGRFNERTVAIAPAVDRERETQRAADRAAAQLWLAVNPTDQSPAQLERVRALFANYQKTLNARSEAQAAADKARADHPLPRCEPT
jgi:hypothetical protein